jgi:hypothetical protein
MGSLTLLLVVALTMQLAPRVVSAGPATRGYEQVRLAEPLRIVVGVPARRQGEKNDRVSTFARRTVVPARVWDCVLAAPRAAALPGAMHLRIESLVSLPPPVC